jgi:hypothetical protein
VFYKGGESREKLLWRLEGAKVFAGLSSPCRVASLQGACLFVDQLEIFRRFYNWIDMDRPMDSGRTKETKNLAERMIYGFLAGEDIQCVVQRGAERKS